MKQRPVDLRSTENYLKATQHHTQTMTKKDTVVDENVEETSTDESQEEQVETPQTPEEQAAELTDMLQRKQAEFQNYQKRMQDQQREYIKFASVRLIERLLPIVDMFDMAVAHKDKKDDFIAGMEMVHKQFNDVLAQENLKSESLLNKPFDPAKAQAMGKVVDDSVPENTIVQEIQKHYTIGDRVIRHARVMVSTKTADENSK